jgi:hypothetical protein
MIKKYKALKKEYKIHEETGNYYDHPSAIEEASKLYLDKHSTKTTKNKYCLRSIIYPKDIAIIYGDDSPDFARKLFLKIREFTGKDIWDPIYYWDFKKYTKLHETVIKLFLQESYTEIYNLTFNQVCNILATFNQSENEVDPVALWLKTKDSYDLPKLVEDNSKLYADMDSPEPKVHDATYHPRIIIFQKDIEIILGSADPLYARYLLMKIRRKYGLPEGCFVTYPDFCDYTGLDKEIVNNFILES